MVSNRQEGIQKAIDRHVKWARSDATIGDVRAALLAVGIRVGRIRISRAMHDSGRAVNGSLPRSRPPPEADRFWGKVDRSGGPEACWPWLDVPRPDGYGQFRFQGTMRGAHKVSWQLSNVASLLRNTCVCHTCDNPICVNPKHLFLSDHAGNKADCIAKGRIARGMRLAKKMTTETVADLRRRWAEGESQPSLAARFGINQSNVNRIAHGKRWVSAPQ